MKTSINTYSYRRVTNKDGNPLSAFEMIDLTKELGIEGIEFTGLNAPEGSGLSRIEFAKQVKAYATEKGVPIVAMSVGADFLQDETVENVKKDLDVAAALGAKLLRHDVAYNCPEGKTFFDLIPFFAEKINEVADYGKKVGVKTCTENHGYFSQDSDRVVALYKAVNNPNFGLLCDIGNFMCADQISVEAVAEACPYAIHVHAKDFLYKSKEECPDGAPAGYFGTRGGNYLCGCAVGTGVVNAKACLEIVKKSGYDGYVTLEFEGPFGDPLEQIKEGLRNLKSYIQ